ncbi:MAG: type II toxin-antitoxin system RelE/ParE family toxin [Brevundimonas sp.]|nr:MAG: type II toxin-antitoxin system RelE/ParE family toxin [Brevundimonas sp.]
MRRVVWSPGAQEDLRAIRIYTAGFSTRAAARLYMALGKAGESLTEFPERGRPVKPGVRELTLVKPYVLRYAVVGSEVWVLSIRHAARRP